MHIALIIGSIRPGRHSHKPALYIEGLLKQAGHSVERLDLQELNFPLFNDTPEQTNLPAVQHFISTILGAEGVIIVFPEYNHSYGSAIKNGLDFLRHRELMHRPVGLVGVSDGTIGGARALAAARGSWPTLGAVILPTVATVPLVPTTFPTAEHCTDAKTDGMIKRMIQEMEVYAPAFIPIRAQLTEKK